MSITRNRELSQFGSFLYINDSSQNIGIATETTPFVGIGTANPTSKLTVRGDVNVSGVITASAFYGTFSGVIGNSNYSSVAGIATVAVGLGTTSNVNTSGIITASAFYQNGTLLVNPDLQTWFIGTGSSIYRLNGNVGIGLSTPTEKLTVNANVSASRFISTITSGTSPFTVLSNTLVTNLNADFLRGKTPPSGDIVGTTDTQTLTNKTLSSPSITTPTIGSGGANFSGTTGTTNLRASTTASGTLTLPAETGTLVSTAGNGVITSTMIANGTIVNEDISNSASIEITKLAASTISGISLGNNLNALTIGSYLNGTSYNGSSAVTISANASSSNTADTLVARDASGDFTAGTISCSYLNATFDVTGANINSTSDENLKTNIKTIENSLETVKSLRGVSFDWKETAKPSYGVIAQEIEEILPELVTTAENKSVNYNGLIGVLIEAVKELSAEVEELKSKLI